MRKYVMLFAGIISLLLAACVSKRASTLTGGEYNATKNQTDYFVLPYGQVALPGKWEKTHYNQVSGQQFFTNKDSVHVAIAFGKYNNYEFNADGAKRGFDFVKAFYEWDSRYFVEKHGLQRNVIETDSTNNYYLYRIYSDAEKERFNTYFLVGEKNGFVRNFSISITDKWNASYKIEFLKQLFLTGL